MSCFRIRAKRTCFIDGVLSWSGSCGAAHPQALILRTSYRNDRPAMLQKQEQELLLAVFWLLWDFKVWASIVFTLRFEV